MHNLFSDVCILTASAKVTRFSGAGTLRKSLLLTAASWFLAAGGLAHAQAPKPGPIAPRPSDATKQNILQKHDLEIKFFSGTVIKSNYHVGGIIKNIGQAPYAGKRIAALYVRSSDNTRWMYANQQKEVPALQPGQEWAIPTFHVAIKGAPSNRFKLVIHTPPGIDVRARDANPKNDEKITDATEVR